MRKLTAVLITLIMMMSVAPVFAEDGQDSEVEQAASSKSNTEATEMTEKAESVEQTGTEEANSDKATPEKQTTRSETAEAGQVELTLIDEAGEKLEDRTTVELPVEITMAELLDDFNKEKHYEIDWKKCAYVINDIEIKDIKIDEFKPEDKDNIVIWISRKVDEQSDSEELTGEMLQTAEVAPQTLKDAYDTTESYVRKSATDSKWEFGDEWIVIGLSRSGKMTEAEDKAYCDRIAAYVANKKSSRIDANVSSENSKVIVALTSLGYDATDVNGYNLLEPLADMNFIVKQGFNGPVWALIAFDSHNYEIPKASANQKQTTREALINLIIGAQLQNKGWDYSGKSSDVDMTCMVIQALTPYYKTDSRVKTAVDNALEWLSSVQIADGSFCTDTGNVSSESQSQVIVALTGLGIDPEKDSRFVKGNNSAMDALMNFYVAQGGFKHISSNWKQNGLATQQGYYALTAYYRFKNNKTSLYDMNELTLKKFTGTVQVGDTGSSVRKIETAGKATGTTRSLGYLALGADEKLDKSLISEDFENASNNQSAQEQEKAYNEYVKSLRMAKTLPWIYMAVGALALIGLLLLLRNREGCEA